MWRKNGDAAISTAEWYRSVQWFEQGLESDLFLLQCCAALAPPECFVKTIQERFGLSNYTSLNFAEHNEYEPVLVQEMLTLIIQIVKERRFCGLSTADNIKRELVYRLAIGDATHSQLLKSLPRHLAKSNQLQEVLDMLAVYSNPSGMKQGKYSLRKSYWKELDLYHPRWNSRDLQIAEERYFRFCKVSAPNCQLPRWTDVFDPLNNLSKIATSKAVLQIIRSVLFYAVYGDISSASLAPDGVLITALHLISLGLDICDSKSQSLMDIDQFGTGVLQHDDESWVVVSHNAQDSFPLLTYATEEFVPESDFGKKQSMLSLLVLLMQKYKEDNESSYCGTKYCNISSLIEGLLKKFANLSSDCKSVLKRMVPALVSCIWVPNSDIRNSATASDSAERKAKAREHQAAIMEKMRAEQSKFIASLSSSGYAANDNSISAPEKSNAEIITEQPVPLCSLCRDSDSKSPLCYLILLQKSRLATFVERGPPSWESGNQSDKRISSGGKEGLINLSTGGSSNSMQSGQNSSLESSLDIDQGRVEAFLDFGGQLANLRNFQLPDTRSNNEELLANIRNFQQPGAHSDNANPQLSLEMLEDAVYVSVLGDLSCSESSTDVLDMSRTTAGSKKSRSAISSVLGAYIQCLPRETSKWHHSVPSLTHVASVLKPSSSVAKSNGFSPSDCDGIHISSCGHAVHQECHDRYLSSLKQRYIRRLGFEGGHFIDPDQGELLCPVCRRFANSILPASSYFSKKGPTKTVPSDDSSTSLKVTSTPSSINNSALRLPLALSLLVSTAKMVGQGKLLKVFSEEMNETIEPSLEPSLRKLCSLYYPHSDGTFLASERLSQSLFLWDTLRYSLISTEIAARGRMNPSSASSKTCLDSLYSELNSSSGFILSLLLCVAQSARSLSRLEVLLRFKGIQLFMSSVCSGVSADDDLLNPTKRRGAFSPLLKHLYEGETHPDIQFWKQSADPILAHDPFSSLMWVLFCIPHPFVSSSDFFFPLVHLFYVVCVVQALLTCYNQENFDTSGFSDYVLHDICSTMSESGFVRQYFTSKYIDPSCDPKDMVRRFTFPYLRRCAVLWKLLQSPSASPQYDSPNMWGGANCLSKDVPDRLTMELNGIRELENMFQIQSLELVLRDEVVRDLALKWCQHFCEEYKARRYRGALFSSPAVPFKLMQLPLVYQDLLQRYVKMHCSECGSVPEEPALCLLCGKLCSPNWKSCCRASKCLNHAVVCGAGVGVFLLVRKTTILLQRAARQAFWPSPYLDAFGEEDHDMCRGKLLYLSEERYAALTYLVASHSLDRTSEVLRQTTISLYGSD
uniref:E3 ubiquitin-protein ligase n=1 Tax=Ananas comosus var. bracteatus TaxID=296719 RepID=A0A6V7PCX7_ANACO|nr:unnamed protein product [Ananas comosus var. bracteatus]